MDTRLQSCSWLSWGAQCFITRAHFSPPLSPVTLFPSPTCPWLAPLFSLFPFGPWGLQYCGGKGIGVSLYLSLPSSCPERHFQLPCLCPNYWRALPPRGKLTSLGKFRSHFYSLWVFFSLYFSHPHVNVVLLSLSLFSDSFHSAWCSLSII